MEDTQTLRVLAENQERVLRDRVEREEQVLLEFEREFSEIRDEQKALTEKSDVYEALARACEAIETLENLDAASLFWNGEQAAPDARAHLAHARQNLEQYRGSVRSVQERREAVHEKIDEQNDVLDQLHYDLRDAVEEAESRREEWVVERDEELLSYRAQVMPWARGFEEDRRFQRSLAAAAACCALLAWIIAIVDLPILERSLANAVPERVASLVRKELPPPPPPAPEPEPVVPDEPEPVLAEETPREPEPDVVTPPEVIEPPSVAETGSAPEPEDTREQVKSKGLLAFRDSFASRANLNTDTQLGAQARLSSAGEEAVGRTERLMVTTSAPGSSGGINLASISRDVGGSGGQGIDGVQVTRVASTIGGAEGPDRPLSAGASAGRTDEEIQIVFDRYKAALYRLYNRELRKDPTLRGQIVLRLTIEPDGSVSMCKLQSSDMGAPVLADEVVNRVLTFDFGAKTDIVAMTIIYPIDFLPTA
jgi:outer membrane biosynthesis protein TonB